MSQFEEKTFITSTSTSTSKSTSQTTSSTATPRQDRDRQGRTGLHLAVLSNDEDDMKAWISMGNGIEDTDDKGYTACHLAAWHGCLHALHVLHNMGCSLESRSHEKWTPMMRAAYSGQVESIKLLMEWGANLTAIDIHGYTALHLAISQAHVAVVEQLLTNPSLDVNVISHVNGNTPAHLLCQNTQSSRSSDILSMFQFLLSHQVNLSILNQDGRTPMLEAVYRNNIHIMDILVNKFKRDVNHDHDRQGRNALAIALDEDESEMITWLRAHSAIEEAPEPLSEDEEKEESENKDDNTEQVET